MMPWDKFLAVIVCLTVLASLGLITQCERERIDANKAVHSKTCFNGSLDSDCNRQEKIK